MPDLTVSRHLAELVDRDLIFGLFKECTPRVLVVTDNLNFAAGQGFGLSQFVDTLKASTIHGMTPIVKTASRYGAPGADIANFNFTDATNGLTKARYDVLFLLGIDSEGQNDLTGAELDAVQAFMQAGGGVFATGDHETLGAALSGNIPRVRGMRKWKSADSPPHVSNTNRHSTNLSGPDETEEFEDQSNTQPQRLYLNFRTQAGGTQNIDRPAHPLMQMKAPRKVLEVFPDHPHEGECRLPASLAGTFTVGGASAPEWPKDAAGADVWPEMVAYSVSHGDGFPTGPTGPKDALVPKMFGAIAAYDGHRANVGRVATDATWHHFVNINLDGSGSGLSGLQSPPGTDTDALTRIRQYYVNLATWLMPKNVRRCLRYPFVLKELARFPLFEELDLPRPPEPGDPRLRAIGETLLRSVGAHRPRWEAQALADDMLEEALGDEMYAKLQAERWSGDGDGGGGASLLANGDLAHAALGGMVAGIAAELAELKDVREIKPHASFVERSRREAREAVGALLGKRRDELRRIDELLGQLQAAR